MPELRKIETSAAYTPSAGEVVEYLAEEDGKLVLKVKKSDGTEETLSGGSGVDVSGLTAVADKVRPGFTFIGAEGTVQEGTMEPAIPRIDTIGNMVRVTFYRDGYIALPRDDDGDVIAHGYMGFLNFYKCASVDTENRTWTGYKAVYGDDGAYSFAETATILLEYGNGYTPVVGKIYSEDTLIAVSGLWQNVITEGLVFRASFTNSLTAETGQDMSDLPSGCSIDELDGKTCLVYDGTGGSDKYYKGKVSDERFAVGMGPFTVTSWVAKGDTGYSDEVYFWWMGDNSPVIFNSRWFNGYTMVVHRGSTGHSSVKTEDREWVFLAASRTGTDVSVYINGELVSTISCSENFPEEAFHIMPGGSTVKYMRDFRFYNRALTADEIAAVMREGE